MSLCRSHILLRRWVPVIAKGRNFGGETVK